MYLSKLVVISIALFFAISCGKNPTTNEIPAWVNEKIGQFQNEPVTNPPRSIYQYEYDGKTVYFVPQICCDVRSILYDENGNVLCYPDGGIGGGGDGNCQDFMNTKTNEKLIWKDDRQ